MIFRGEYDLRLDPKNRVVLPASWRSQLAHTARANGDGRLTLSIARSISLPALEMYLTADFNAYSDKAIARLDKLQDGALTPRLRSVLESRLTGWTTDVSITLGSGEKPGRGLVQFDSKMVEHANLGSMEGLGACGQYLAMLREGGAKHGSEFHERTIKLLGGRDRILIWNPVLYLGWVHGAEAPWYSNEPRLDLEQARSLGIMM